MMCREFKHDAASLMLWELSQTQDAEILGHAEKCEACGAWLRKQRTLAVSVQTLQARTASLEAGPDVERALLHAFRQDTLRGAERTLGGVAERSVTKRPAVTSLSTPAVLRMSRFFEVGAYVALAAAILVGVFLGFRLLGRSSNEAQVQAQQAPSTVEPVIPKPVPAAPTETAGNATPAAAVAPRLVESAAAARPHAMPSAASEEAQTVAVTDAGYTDLMFCDPLSCSAETQVVRVELTGTNGHNSQPQMADLVVGYDGVVRAARIVN
jgi:hypothetical protein